VAKETLRKKGSKFTDKDGHQKKRDIFLEARAGKATSDQHNSEKKKLERDPENLNRRRIS